jgi:hypothetical protein
MPEVTKPTALSSNLPEARDRAIADRQLSCRPKDAPVAQYIHLVSNQPHLQIALTRYLASGIRRESSAPSSARKLPVLENCLQIIQSDECLKLRTAAGLLWENNNYSARLQSSRYPKCFQKKYRFAMRLLLGTNSHAPVLSGNEYVGKLQPFRAVPAGPQVNLLRYQLFP